MAFDGLFLHKLLAELAPILTGAKINKIHQPQAYGITLKLNCPQSGNGTLYLSAHPQDARLHFSAALRENPANPPLFCMVLRKHLEGGRILGLSQRGLDRLVEIKVEARNEVGDRTRKRLVLEIMGKHSNLILLEEDGTILAGIKQYGGNVSRYRQVLPHIPYLAPREQGKINPLLATEEEWAEAILQAGLGIPVAAALQKTVEGLSPGAAREVAYRGGLEGTVDEMGLYEFRRLYEILRDLIAAEQKPTITSYDKGREFYFQPLTHLALENGDFEERPNLSALLDAFYEQKESANAFESRKRELLKVLRQSRERLGHKVAKQEEELAAAESGDRYRVYGELLSAFLFQVPNGAEETVLQNFYEGGSPITIPLEPALSPQANAQRYFRLYNKKKAAKSAIHGHLQANREELEYLDSLIAHGEMAENPEDLEALKEECREAGYIKEKKRKAKEKTGPTPPFSFFSQGYEILVGRNHKSNDRLTLKTAAKDDFWFHAKDIPGSHVILKRKGKQNPPPAAIAAAAAAAAWFSKARQSANVPVDYTPVNQVKKPAGAKPGMVVYFNQTTIYANPEKPPENET